MPKQNPKSSANSRPSMRAGRGAWNPRTFEQIGRDAPPHARSRDPQMSPACAQAPDDRIADTDYSTTLAEMARIHLYPISKARWSLNSFLFERDRYRRISAGIPLLKSPISATLVRVEIASRPPVFTSDGLRQTADLPVDVANPTCRRLLSSSFQNSRIPPGRSFFASPVGSTVRGSVRISRPAPRPPPSVRPWKSNAYRPRPAFAPPPRG